MLPALPATLIALAVVTGAATAQTRPSFMHGQNVSPAYEGWERDDAGNRFFLFGYMNRNWEEELDVPAGPDNSFTPGGPDADNRRTSCRDGTVSSFVSRCPRDSTRTTRWSGR